MKFVALLFAAAGCLAAATPQPTLVADIGDNDYAASPGDARAGIDHLLAADGIAYWSEYSDETAFALWCAHGDGPAVLLHDHLRGELLQMDLHDGAVYYALDVRNGRTEAEKETNKHWIQVWRTAGSPETTTLVHEYDVPDQSDEGTPRSVGAKLHSIDGSLYICQGWSYSDANNGYYRHWSAGIDQLWRYDTGDAEAVLLADFEAKGQSMISSTFVYLDGMAYATANLPDYGTELVRFDLAAPQDGIELVKDIEPGPASGAPDIAFARRIAGAIYFAADDGDKGLELWRCDGNTTTRVADINPGSAHARPANLAPFGDRICFSARDGVHGEELWSIARDGSDARRESDINPDGGSLINYPMRHGDHLYFTAWTPDEGRELYRFDGATVELFHAFHPGSEGLASAYSSSAANMISVAEELFFSAEDDGLWYLGPDATGLVRLGAIEPLTRGPSSLHASDGLLYLPGFTTEIGVELYRVPTIAQDGDWVDSLGLYGRARNDEFNSHELTGGDGPGEGPDPGDGDVIRSITLDCTRPGVSASLDEVDQPLRGTFETRAGAHARFTFTAGSVAVSASN